MVDPDVMATVVGTPLPSILLETVAIEILLTAKNDVLCRLQGC